jgi:hypothetical protein
MSTRWTELHRDERGTISILSVVTILGLTMLMGMVINVGRHVDDKIKMQNAADAGAFSGGVILARGMNGLAYSNHLLCDVFALTAFMREARDGNAESLVPEVLAAWSTIGPIFARSEFQKFATMGPAISAKVPMEQEVVTTYCAWARATSELILPVLEYILGQPGPDADQMSHWIPQYERALVRTIPFLAQTMTGEIARRHGVNRLRTAQDEQERGNLAGVLWRMRAEPVGYPDEADPNQRVLPAIDTCIYSPDASAVGWTALHLQAIQQRRDWSHRYLRDFNAMFLEFFPVEAKMSQFFMGGNLGLWAVFTCGQLNRLLDEEYPVTNLPHMMRLSENGLPINSYSIPSQDLNNHLAQNYMFIAAAYRRHFRETSPRYFFNRLSGDALTFAQVSIFVPRGRMVLVPADGSGSGSGSRPGLGGIPGQPGFNQPSPPPATAGGEPTGGNMVWTGEGWPTHWDLWNQNWTVQLVPATADALGRILQTPPQQFAPGVQLPNFCGAAPADLRRMNTH